MSPLVLLAVSLTFVAWLFSKPAGATVALDIPTVSYGRFVPDFINRLLFVVKGPALIYEGYRKVRLAVNN